MKSVLFSAFLFFLAFSGIVAQNDPVLLTIENEKVTKSEFLAVYNKNNVKEEPLNAENVKEYLELFINYKLKVKEAESLKLDTSKSFINELAGYRRQLAQPYLSNREVTDQLLLEAYDRMKWDIRASHILIKVSPNASPADTLKAYNRIMDIRKKLVAGGKFDEIARKYSEDESAKDRPGREGQSMMKGNGGDLGYFSVLNLYYEFETAAYNLKTGEISNPVRTPVGYHLILVNDRKPALGKVQAGHILIKDVPGKEDSIKARIDEAYKQILDGVDFETVVKNYSDDKGTVAKGGILPWFGSFRMVPPFVLPLYDMKPGEISKPVQTIYGWHIIKLVDKKPIGTYDESKSTLKTQISRDKRAFIARDKLVDKLKSEYKFKADEKVLKELVPLINDSIYMASWHVPAAPSLSKPVCTIAENPYLLGDFADYLMHKQSQIKEGDDIFTFVKTIFNQYSEEMIIEHENTKLEEKYPEFKALMKEYRDGILLFDLMDKNVWSKAVKDTSGLKKFYETINQNYLYGPRAEAVIYTCKGETELKALQKLLKKAPKKGYTPETISTILNKDSIPAITYQIVKVEKGVNPLVDQTPWVNNQNSVIRQNNEIKLVSILNLLEPQPKPLQEVKGLVTAEYQNYLEQQWVSELRNKYTWKVDEKVLDSIYQK
ncbi:MAG: peptidylprolyl isomerase [Bacteroidales bacterium]|jgi:peptidyl-prolyl cis-trans isomerase SurA|nr:peptidylprolyl isomerase [Bacteroidales bacterium]